MAHEDDRRLLEADDLLLRLVKPGQHEGERVGVAAFRDHYKKLSFRLKRAVSPARVLATFGSMSGIRDNYSPTGRALTPAEMYDAGFRIAELGVQVIRERGYGFWIYEGGHEVNEKGHVDVIDGQSDAPHWRRHARLLTREETLG